MPKLQRRSKPVNGSVFADAPLAGLELVVGSVAVGVPVVGVPSSLDGDVPVLGVPVVGVVDVAGVVGVVGVWP